MWGVGVRADDCEDGIDGLCVVHEAFGKKVHVVEGTFENGQTKGLMWFCEEVDSCSRSSRPVLPVAAGTL